MGDGLLRLMGMAGAKSFLRANPKCFVAGTPVHTEHGLKPIETVEVGERVWAYEREEQGWRLAVVTRTFERVSDMLVDLTLSDGTTVTGTDGHPFWVIEGVGLSARRTGDHGHDEPITGTPGRWVAMGDLRSGDVLLTRHPKTVRVATAVTRRAAEPVYNLEVEGLHNYAVATGVLVHNANYPLDELGRPIEKAARDAATDAAKTPAVVSFARPASRSPSLPDWANQGLDRLAQFRQQLGPVPGAGKPDGGTVAMLEIGGQRFFGMNAHRQPVKLRANNITRTHAEFDVFQQAANANLSGGRARLFVDSELCRACSKYGGVRSLARQLGLSEVEIVTAKGVRTIKV